jgi:archaellum component FlaC
MKTTTVLALAAGAAIIGLLIGMALGRSGREELAARADRQEELSAQVAGVTEKLDAMEGRFDDLGGQIGSVGEGIEGQSQQVASLSDKIGEMGTSVSEKLDEMGSSVSDSVSGAVSGLSTELSDNMSLQFSSLSTQIAGIARPEAAAADPVSGVRLLPGRTLMIGEGAARIFLSGVSRDSQSARVAVDGTQVQTLAVGESMDAGNCEITLTAIDAPGAMIDSSCGGGGEDGGGEDGGGGSAPAEPMGLGEGTEIPVAKSASFADGAVRIYLSRIDPQTQEASVAINGTTLSKLKVGDPVTAGDCTVNLTGMDRSSVSVKTTC